MKHIYWCIQHLDEVGGTEMVSTDLMNHLVDYYDITAIVTGKIDKQPVYKLDPRIKVFCLNISKSITRLDQSLDKAKKQKRFLKCLGLLLKAAWIYGIRKSHYRHKIHKLVKKNEGTIICSSADNYMFCPKHHEAIFHFHFNAKNYFTKGNKSLLKMSRKPDKIVFLSKSTLNEITKVEKELSEKSTFIYNPIRFIPILDTTFNNNRIIFLGRFADQKNPLLALAVAKELKNKGLTFTLDMFGEGTLTDQMQKYINDNQLEDYAHICGLTHEANKEILKSDLLLLTSKYEGFVLVKGEANALSRPVISSNWGDTVEEMFEQGKDGFIIDSLNPKDYADKIEEIFKDKNMLLKLKKNSYLRSFELSYDKIIPEWRKILG